MHPVVESKRDELSALFRRFGVRRLEVFASAARGEDFDESTSDINFLMELPDPTHTSPLVSYFGLKDRLESVLGKPVDLVSDGSGWNPCVSAAIHRDRQLVLAG